MIGFLPILRKEDEPRYWAETVKPETKLSEKTLRWKGTSV